MHGALYLRFLFDAAIAFSHDPNKQKYGWINRQQAANGLKKILSPSLRITGQIKSYDQQQLFDWVKRSETRYRFIYDLRRTRLSDLASLNDKINLAALDLNKSIYDLIDQAQAAGMSEEQIQAEIAKKHDAFLKGFFLPVSAAPGLLTASPAKEISEAKEEKPTTGDVAPINTEDHFTALARSGVAGVREEERKKPSATPPPVTIHPPTPIDRGVSIVRTVIESGPVQDAVSGAQVFTSQTIKRAPEFMRGFFDAGRSRVAGGAAKGAAGAASGAAKGLAAKVATRGVPVVGQALMVKDVGGWFWKHKKTILWITLGIFVGMWLLINQIMQTQPLLVFKDDGTIDLITDISEGDGSGSTPIPDLTLKKTGPSQVANNEEISYTINAVYTGSAQIELTDQIPENTTFVSATGVNKTVGEPNVTAVTWALKDQTEGIGNYTFNLVVRPIKEDVRITNKVIAKIIGGTTPVTPVNPEASDWESFIRGQGRNVNILGDEDSFTQAVLTNGASLISSDKEANVRLVYRAAVAKNVNPLIVLSTWGTEHGFKLSGGTEFSCPVRKVTNFLEQASCSAQTYNYWMDAFDKNKAADGTLTVSKIDQPGVCVFDDAFIYAAEMYGPECRVYDQNEYYRSNMMKFMKKFLGQA